MVTFILFAVKKKIERSFTVFIFYSNLVCAVKEYERFKTKV